MTDRGGLLEKHKVNDSDKQRGVLPETLGHRTETGDGGCGQKMKQHKWKIVGGFVVLLAALIIGLVLGNKSGGDGPSPSPTPGPGPDIDTGYNLYYLNKSDIMTEKNKISGVLSFNNSYLNEAKFLAKTARTADAALTITPKEIPIGENNKYIENVKFEFSQVDYKVTKVLFTDNNSSRFNIPLSAGVGVPNKMQENTQMTTEMAGFSYKTEPFGFEFRSTREENVINVDTHNSDFIMTDKFMQIDLQIPSQRIYGLGERTREFSLAPGTWTMWSNGRETPYDDGTGGLQTYGVHPFALIQTQRKDEWMGIFFRNSNAQSPIISYKGDKNATFTYITTGGELEMYFFTKGNAKQIISAYHNLIGKPSLPPFWSLGWQFASYDYENLTKYDEVIKGYKDADIPFEGVFFDIPYMDQFTDFSVDQTTFPDLVNWTLQLHSDNHKLTLIVDAGLAANNIESKYYSQAQNKNALLKSTLFPDVNRGDLVQKLWPGKTVFLDFFNDTAIDIWMQGLNDLWAQAPYDGIWLDLNEASGDCNGECGATIPNAIESTNQTSSWFGKFQSVVSKFQDDTEYTNHTWYKSYNDQNNQSTYNLPFSPGPEILTKSLLSLNATHMDGETEYNLHSLFGHAECKATHKVFTDSTFNTQSPRAMEGLRTFILSRSTFAGSGQYAQHWLGDNHRDWENMQWSIAGVMNFNMFGIPMVGPDTCGFYESSKLPDEADQRELCARWIQLATFYPFARQHHDKTGTGGKGGPPLEPYVLGGTTENPTEYVDMAKAAIRERFSYMRFMYTCLFKVSKDGGSCFDPLMYHYPHDDTHFMPNNTEHTFLVGDAVKVTPVLKPNATELWSYFPNGKWVSLRNTSIVEDVNNSTGGDWRSLDMNASKDGVHSHLRPGYMIPMQDCGDKTCNTTANIRSIGQTRMIINPDAQGHAKGILFLDAGDTLAEINNNDYEYYEFQLGGKSIKKWNMNSEVANPVNALGITDFQIVNAEEFITTDFACWVSEDKNTVTWLNVLADKDLNKLTITTTDGSALQPMYIKNIYFGDSSKDINLCGARAKADNVTQVDASYYTPTQTPDLTQSDQILDLKNNLSQYPDLILDICVELAQTGQHSVHISWSYLSNTYKRPSFEVPFDIIEPRECDHTIKLSDYVIYTANASGPFTLDIINPVSKTILYTLNGDMQLTEYLSVINGVAHTFPDNPTSPGDFQGVMGILEQTSTNLFLKDGVYSLWSKDTANPVQTTKAPGANLYGTHPFIMAKATDKSWFGQFINMASAQDWWIKNNAATGDVTINTIATGGKVNMYFFVGENPDELTQAYHSIIGTPVVTPQWALGWHQCRWGYRSTEDLQDVVDKFISYKLPLETQWSDIDYMDNYKDFTVDQTSFSGLSDFVKKIQTDHNMKYIPIIDAGVAQRNPSIENYDAYNAGVIANAFIKAGSDNNTIFTGQVWAVDAAFPDWFNSETQNYWNNMMTQFHDMVGFNGVWLDMNEASNMLCNGVCYDDQKAAMSVQNYLPYIPTGRDLETQSISLDAVHSDGTIELDAHSLFGTMETAATHKWFKNIQNERTMIISRSSYAGMGKFGSRWLGDNFSIPEYMAYSVTGVMGNNIAGITLAGSDICGFIGNTTAELCARWYSLGAYYPFSRNHNSWNTDAQEPWQFANVTAFGSTTMLDVIQNAMYRKLHMIRYMYTQMSLIQESGGSYFRPLFYDFPNDKNAYADQELNVMLGPSLKLSVQSGQLDADTTVFYFPEGKWCDVYCKSPNDCCITAPAEGKKTPLQTQYTWQIYLHLREGHIVPMQNATDLGYNPYVQPTGEKSGNVEASSDYTQQLTTTYLQQNQTDFHVLPACNATKCIASGTYINDDGLTLDLTQRNTYTLTYEHDIQIAPSVYPMSMTVTVKTSGLIKMINANDLLNKIEIYDATNLGMDTASGAIYGVTVNFIDPTTMPAQSLGNANWDDKGDKLKVVAPNHLEDGSKPIDLTLVDTIVFTISA